MSEHPWLVQLNEQGYRLTDSRRAVVEIMAQSTHALTPIEIYDEARKNFSEKELVDLTLAVTTINTYNRINIAFGADVGSYKVGQFDQN